MTASRRDTPPRAPRRRSAARRRQLLVRRLVALLAVLVLIALVVWRAAACAGGDGAEVALSLSPFPPPAHPAIAGDGVKVASFLGDHGRRYYGRGPAPKRLGVFWRVRLGKGWTSGKYEDDPPSEWAGSGWTGQPAVVVDGGRASLIVPSYDHRLRRIDARSGEVVWSYRFDDIIKGSPTVFRNPRPAGDDDRYIVVAGSRRGYPLDLDDERVAPLRALTFGSGTELWRQPVPQTECYSRDCDGSAVYHDGRLYAGVESGWFYALDPLATEPWGKHRRPRVLAERLLLGDERAAGHESDLALEASPSVLNDTLYVASGAGHLYGLRPSDLEVVWDYHIGSDLNGTPVTTRRGRLLQAVEKEYIKGRGGMLSLDPSRPPGEATEWYFPTGDREVGDWKGGVIGSAAVNDEYNSGGRRPALCAFIGIDGYLYVVSQDTLAARTVQGPNRERGLATPVQVAKVWMGGGISTPVFVGDALVAAGYDQRVHLYRLRFEPAQEGDEGALPSASGDGSFWTVSITERAQHYAEGAFESTPVVWNGRVYIGCRDGWFYCLGDTP